MKVNLSQGQSCNVEFSALSTYGGTSKLRGSRAISYDNSAWEGATKFWVKVVPWGWRRAVDSPAL